MSLIGSGIAVLGRSLHLPEMGFSEAASGNPLTTMKAASNALTRVKGASKTGQSKVGAFFAPNSTLKGQQLYLAGVQDKKETIPVNTGQTGGVGGAPIGSDTGGSVGGGGGGVGVGAGSAYGNTPNQPIAAGLPSPLDLINQQFDNEMASLGGMEGTVNQNFTNAKNVLDTNRTELLGSDGQSGIIGTEQANRKAGVQADYNNAQQGIAQNYQQNEAQLRQLLSDLQQRNAARLSITGNSSSVADALNESFGKQATQGVTQIQTQRAGQEADILNQKNKEMSAIDDFYGRQRADLNAKYTDSINQIAQERDMKLNAIADNKRVAASQKSAATVQAWQDYLTQKRAVDLQTYEAAQNLAVWREKRAAYAANQISWTPVTNSLGEMYSFNKQTGQYIPANSTGQQGGTSVNWTMPSDVEKSLQVAGL